MPGDEAPVPPGGPPAAGPPASPKAPADADAGPVEPAPAPSTGRAVAKAWLTLFLLCAGTFLWAAVFALPDAVDEMTEGREESYHERSERLARVIAGFEPRVPAGDPARGDLDHASIALLQAELAKDTNIAAAHDLLSEGFQYLCDVSLAVDGDPCPPPRKATALDAVASPFFKVGLAGLAGVGAALTARPAQPVAALRSLAAWFKGRKGAPT